MGRLKHQFQAKIKMSISTNIEQSKTLPSAAAESKITWAISMFPTICHPFNLICGKSCGNTMKKKNQHSSVGGRTRSENVLR